MKKIICNEGLQITDSCSLRADNQETLESIRSISRGLGQAKRSDGRSMKEFLEVLAMVHGISLKSQTDIPY